MNRGNVAETLKNPPVFFTLDSSRNGGTLELLGNWTLANVAALREAVETSGVSALAKLTIEGKDLDAIDTAGSLYLLKLLEKMKVSEPNIQGFSEDELSVIRLVKERLGTLHKLKNPYSGILARIGRSAVDVASTFVELLRFIGHSASEFVASLFNPRTIRMRELFVQIEQCCVNAIPIVSLVMLLIGIVIAYLFADQLKRYGGNIFIVEGVTIAIARELSPVIVAILIAGRSGSAFTAQLGAMKLNEEVEALVTLGLEPMRVLVLPRVLALVLAMPILVFVGDVVGIAGSMLIADLNLDVTGPTFLDRLRSMVSVRHFVLGFIKAPVFAVFIAVIGCRMGLNVENNARSIGLSTTATVVQSIVSVILLNAAFAVIFQQLGY